ncbi:MAG: hypothetical protein LUQ71_10330 [Methanoregula sp.]|nr:hypothetical protein [Methanoregula sp.]
MPEYIERVMTLTNLRGYILRGDACKDLAQDDSKDPSIFRLRILLLTPGTWNDVDFAAAEIKAAIKRATDANAAAGAYRIPVVNGHNDDMTDIYGKVIAATYGKAQTAEGEKEGSIFDLECKSNLPPGDKIKDLAGWAPELIRYSARLRGQWLMPQSAKENVQMVNFSFVHVGTVPDPACTDAGIVEELARRSKQAAGPAADLTTHSDFDLSVSAPDTGAMATQEDLARLERENADLKAKVSDLTAQLKQKDEQIAARDTELQRAVKAPVVASILALHKEADPKFLESMSLEQLTAYDADLKKVLAAQQPAGSSERSLSNGGNSSAKTPKEVSLKRAEQLFGSVRGR